MLVICAPYGRNEVTAAALRLAEFAFGEGLPVRYVAVGARESRVHSFWDRTVVSPQSHAVFTATTNARCVVWFMHDPALRRKVGLTAAKNCLHVLVAGWHSFDPAVGVPFTSYDLVVCPSRTAAEALAASVGKSGLDSTRVTWARWDAGLPPVPHEGRVRSGRTRLVMICDANAIDEGPAVPLRTADVILAEEPKVAITLLASKSWPRRERRRLAGLLDQYPGRLRLVYQADWPAQAVLLHEHDWCFVASVRSDFGLHVSRALQCGLPTFAYAVPPFDEHIRTNVNGALIPCEIWTNWCGAPTAVASAAAAATTIVPIIHRPKTLVEFQNADWGLMAAKSGFEDWWMRFFRHYGLA